MSVTIQYAYFKQQCWLYRRNYPKELQAVLGSALKQSLKTGDARVAKARAAEVNAKFEEIVTKAKAGVHTEKPVAVRVVAPVFNPVVLVGRLTVGELAKQYLEVLGGQENLVTIDACITRLRLTLKDRSIVDERKLKALGAAGVVKLGEQNLQVILGPLAEIIAGEMKALR